MKNIKIFFCPEWQAVECKPMPTDALISIIEPERIGENGIGAEGMTYEEARSKRIFGFGPAPKFENWNNKLQLFFHDVDSEKISEKYYEQCRNNNKQHTGLHLFDMKMAHSILEFLDKLPVETELLLIHCAAGVSRSAAVAKFAVEYLRSRKEWEISKTNVSDNYGLYNKRVYQILRETSGMCYTHTL